LPGWWEALDLYAAFYRRPADWRLLLEEWGLAAKRDAAAADLSGRQRQRLFIALSLVGQPEVVFLDELTTGLDPQARRATWELVKQVRAKGTTVMLNVLAKLGVSSRAAATSAALKQGLL
jgi:ABC-2 type transport system ATP-binding protein